MDGHGNGPADGVTGGRAWRAGTLSLQFATTHKYIFLELIER